MDIGEMKKAAEQNGALREAAGSAEARKLMETVDGNAIERAVEQGDANALKDALAKLLSTPEGKALAARVRKAAGQK